MLFLEGKEQSTISPNKTCYAKTTLDTVFEKEFAIYDLRRFLSILALFKEPEVTLSDKFMTIFDKNDKKRKIIYKFCSPEIIQYPPKGKSIDAANVLEQFELTESNFSNILKTSSIFGHEYIKIFERKGNLIIATFDGNDVDKDLDDFEGASFDLGETKNNGFAYFVRIANMRFLPGSYDVIISNNHLKFDNKDLDIYYICPFEAKISTKINE